MNVTPLDDSIQEVLLDGYDKASYQQDDAVHATDELRFVMIKTQHRQARTTCLAIEVNVDITRHRALLCPILPPST